jgi:hypothetical protein
MDKYTLLVLLISWNTTFQRLLREDVKWCPSLRAPYRGLLVAGLSMIIGPVLDAVLIGNGWVSALITGIVSIIPTILNLLASATANTHASAAMRNAAGKALLVVATVVVCATTQSACAAVCPIINAADKICPLIIVQLEDGTTVKLPKHQVIQMAIRQKLEEGGAK